MYGDVGDNIKLEDYIQVDDNLHTGLFQILFFITNINSLKWILILERMISLADVVENYVLNKVEKESLNELNEESDSEIEIS